MHEMEEVHKLELHDLYISPNIIRIINQGGGEGKSIKHDGDKRSV